MGGRLRPFIVRKYESYLQQDGSSVNKAGGLGRETGRQ